MRKGKWDANVQPHIYNWRPGINAGSGSGGNLSKWQIAMGKMRAEGYRPKCMTLGTSKMMGAGGGTSGGGAFTVGAAAKTKTKIAADFLNTRGIAVSRESIFAGLGLSNITDLINYDPRLAVAADWTLSTSGTNASIGGGEFNCANGLTGTMSFSPAGTVDKVDVLYVRRTDRGTFTVSDGASVVDTVNANGANAILRRTATLSSRGTGKVINFNRTSAQAFSVDIAGIIAYDSLTPAIEMVNCGRFGSRASDYTSAANPWNPFPTLAYYAPDITFIAFGANELNAGIDVTTFKTNVQTLITQAKLSGDVVLMIEIMGDTTGSAWGSATTQAAYIQALYDLADSNDCPLLNENGMASGLIATGGYTIANAAGLMADGIHENARANAIVGKLIADILTA